MQHVSGSERGAVPLPGLTLTRSMATCATTLILVLVPALVAAGCANSRQDPNAVATAANRTWTIEQAAQLLAPTELPADPAVVRALADLWIDYTLLASAAARDPAMQHIDVSPLVDELVADRVLQMLRDTVIVVDTPTTAELRRRHETEAPGSLVRARHILLAWPADDAERDRVRAEAAALRQRVTEGGEDFAAVAREHSQDPGSAAQGGDLGILGMGQYLPAIEEAALALQNGQVSQPVESPWGVHLIRADSRQTPDLAVFRSRVFTQLAMRAESTYIAGMEASFTPSPADGAAATVRDMAQNPRLALSNRDANRNLYSYRGGGVTRAEALREIQRMAPELRQQIASSRDDEVPLRFLRGMAHRELLLNDATRRGYTVRPEVRQGLVDAAHANLAETVRQLGLATDGDPAAIDERVTALLAGMLSGERREVTPLGAMSHVLREQYRWGVGDQQVEAAVRRTTELRQPSADPTS